MKTKCRHIIIGATGFSNPSTLIDLRSASIAARRVGDTPDRLTPCFNMGQPEPRRALAGRRPARYCVASNGIGRVSDSPVLRVAYYPHVKTWGFPIVGVSDPANISIPPIQ